MQFHVNSFWRAECAEVFEHGRPRGPMRSAQPLCFGRLHGDGDIGHESKCQGWLADQIVLLLC